MNVVKNINLLPKELQWKVLLYTKHPVVDIIKSDECYPIIIKLKRDFYDYIQNNMLFFEETEVMDNTNTYFNPDMMKILYKVYIMDMSEDNRNKTIEWKRKIKRNVYSVYRKYDKKLKVTSVWKRNKKRLVRV